ncbi:sce7725 family protein [Sodalis ligni]|uniref:sce7725 family protein n=1 Tax=Sodalis ligni TaxID=2697027 RepID=UPI001BDEC568|nr:sce7725 family protein [Sodalis ligni]
MRGKQFELIALRELAPRLPNNIYKPIIEPVRKNLLPLLKTIKIINEYNIEPIVIINPNIGDYTKEHINLNDLLLTHSKELRFIPCVKFTMTKIIIKISLIH